MMKQALLVISILGLGFSACKKDKKDQQVPLVLVDLTLSLDLPSYNTLNIVGGWEYIDGGSRGILVYRLSQDEFVALDRHCPYESSNGDRVFVETNNVIAVDSLGCGSKYSIIDGLVNQGPSQFPLTQYNTSYNTATNVLRVFN